MGDKSLRGRGCVSKKYNCGGKVKKFSDGGDVSSDEACARVKKGFFESDSEFDARSKAAGRACGDALARERTGPKPVAKTGTQASSAPMGDDATETGLKGYATGATLKKRMKEQGLE
jgi:hypothetical protein